MTFKVADENKDCLTLQSQTLRFNQLSVVNCVTETNTAGEAAILYRFYAVGCNLTKMQNRGSMHI